MKDQPIDLGPFAVRDRIGEGGMAVVYRGTHRDTGVPVAIKVVEGETSEAIRRRFHEEVQAHAGLAHPGIVYLFEYGTLDESASRTAGATLREGSPYVAMEFADRGSVRDAIPLAHWNDVRRILVQVLDALAYSHARGVIHRDLKPANFLVFGFDGDSETNWRVKLADFGLAHALAREKEADAESLARTAGTPHYMSPEQIGGRWRSYGPWTDLYALGCIAWRLVCGRPPFTGDNMLSVAFSHQTDERPPLDPQFQVPDALEGWIHRAMQPEPSQRFQRAADALWELPDPMSSEPLESDAASGDELAADPSSTEDSTRTPDTTIQLADTEIWTLESTVELETVPETSEPREPESGESAPTSWPNEFRSTSQRERAKKRTRRIDSDSRTPVAAGATIGEPIELSRPPLPERWRPQRTAPLPAPLVDAGLGLFGLREPPFVDRRTEGDRIWRALREVVDRQTCQMISIHGGAGTGKSRLAEWMVTRAHELGAADVLRASHTPGGGSNEGLRGAVERKLRTFQLNREGVASRLREILPPLGETTDETHDHDVRALTEYLRPTEEAEATGGPAFQFSDVRQQRSLLVRLLRRLARRRPVVLWLDNLHWASEAFGLLEHLAETGEETPSMLVLATLRSDVLSERPALEERLEDLEAVLPSTRLTLEPLETPYQRKLLDGLLPLQDRLAERLAERTEGHPLFAMQLLRHWIDRGDLVSGSDGFRVPDGRELELPSDIHQLWVERIESLVQSYSGPRKADVLASLEMAAVLGREVDDAEWEALTAEIDASPPSDLVDRLVKRGLAKRTTSGWAYAHGLLVESLARLAREDGRWSAYHRRCARFLESELASRQPGPRERIAEHWVASGERLRATELFLEEIRLSRRRSQDDESMRLLERRGELLDALDTPENDPLRLEQGVELALIQAARGELDRAKSSLTEIWNKLGSDDAHLRAVVAEELASVETKLGDRTRARDWAQRALDAARETDDARLRGKCHRTLTWILTAEAELAAAERHAKRALELARETDDRYGEIRALWLRAFARESRGGEGVEESFEAARRKAAETGHVIQEALALTGLGEHARFSGDLESARRYHREFLQKVREMTRPTHEAIAELNLAQVEFRDGELERGSQHFAAAETLLERVGAAESRSGLLHLLRLTRAVGEGDESEVCQLWETLRSGWPDDWRLIKDHPWLLETAVIYARKHGWRDRAVDYLELARELWERLGDGKSAERVAEQLAELA